MNHEERKAYYAELEAESDHKTARMGILVGTLTKFAREHPDRYMGIDVLVGEVNAQLIILNRAQREFYALSSNPRSHNKCPSVWADIEFINKCDYWDKIIITKDMAYKIAESPREAQEYADELEKRSLNIAFRRNCIRGKMARAFQGEIVNSHDRVVIDEARFRKTYDKE